MAQKGRTKMKWWEPYTKKQIESYIKLMKGLTTKYKIGRDGIKPHSDWPRKSDPGPAFPMEDTLDKIFGGE